jgi:hypothetical protein
LKKVIHKGKKRLQIFGQFYHTYYESSTGIVIKGFEGMKQYRKTEIIYFGSGSDLRDSSISESGPSTKAEKVLSQIV